MYAYDFELFRARFLGEPGDAESHTLGSMVCHVECRML